MISRAHAAAQGGLAEDVAHRVRQWSTEAGRTEQRDAERDQRAVRPTPPPVRQEPPQGAGDDPARRAADRIKATNDRLVENKGITRQGNEGVTGTGLDTARSSVVPKDQMDFPADWRERINRPGRQRVKMTAREKILDTMQQPVAASFNKDRFEDVIQFLEKQTGIPIVMDKSTLEQAGVNYDSPVTLHADQVSLRTVLRKVLGEVGLTYVIKEEAIQVVTREQAKEMLVTRSYDVTDLVGVVDMRFGPILGQAHMAQNVRQLIDLIQSSLEPGSWEINGRGGFGTITFYPPTMSLIVKNTAEVHYMLGGSFR